MMASTMMFLVFVSVLASAAAWVGERGARRSGVPTRGWWLMALALGPMLLLLTGVMHALGLSGGAVALPGGWSGLPVVRLPGSGLGGAGAGPATGPGPGWNEAAAVLWVVSLAAMAVYLLQAHLRLRAERAGWERRVVMGREVFISSRRGPAVGGVWNSWIVLPEWVLQLPREELRMVLLHEEDHLRGRDPELLAAALAFLAAAPWNPVAWWQFARLRAAIEVDCDRRVLSRTPNAWAYGNALLTVAAGSSGPSLGLAAFTERGTSLRTRILLMTAGGSGRAILSGAVLLMVGGLLAVQACRVENPLARDASLEGEDAPKKTEAVEDVPARPEVTLRGEDIKGMATEPTFTPFTVAPSILNRREVIQAMQDAYPPLLRDAGVGGTVRVYFFIDETGKVQNVRIDQSSGHQALDDAALKVARVYEFAPALNREKLVPVWVSFPISFRVKN
ncbi:MAG: TonB family protein [Gemmatimonadota bacterium]